VWFRRWLTRSNGHLAIELDPELASQLRLAAGRAGQSPERFAIRLLRQAVAQEARRAQAEHVLAALTPRERQVAWLIARGFTNRRIAEALVISTETVKTHVRHVLEKLGVHSKTELRLLLLELGIREWLSVSQPHQT
jgi:DNA-binding NarL/FixJ family response regulator